jgi:carboxyl-terminal processing protease
MNLTPPSKSNSTKHNRLMLALVLGVVVLAFAAGFMSRGFFINQDYPMLFQAVSILQDHGLKPIPTEPALEYGMIQGALQAYNDPYTVFMQPAQNKLQTEQLQGSFGGIGVRMEKDSQGFIRLYPVPDSTSLKAGVLDGDRLLAVEALPVTSDTGMDTIQAALNGPVGQKVSVTIGHAPDFAPLKLSIDRAETALPSVTWNLVPEDSRVGIVHVSIIASTTSSEIQTAIADLQGRGASYFILDLRNNGGGLLDAGVDVARLFLKQGLVIDQQYRGQPVQSFNVDQPGPLADLPLVILINKGTASAAEIIAGALRAERAPERVKLIGSPTYGKDTIQLVFDMPDGSSLHVTAAKWWVPGFPVPLQPDVSVADDPNSDAIELKAVQVLASLAGQ